MDEKLIFAVVGAAIIALVALWLMPRLLAWLDTGEGQ
jgi:hypothetical protein